jgi:hypothetical protein
LTDCDAQSVWTHIHNQLSMPAKYPVVIADLTMFILSLVSAATVGAKLAGIRGSYLKHGPGILVPFHRKKMCMGSRPGAGEPKEANFRRRLEHVFGPGVFVPAGKDAMVNAVWEAFEQMCKDACRWNGGEKVHADEIEFNRSIVVLKMIAMFVIEQVFVRVHKIVDEISGAESSLPKFDRAKLATHLVDLMDKLPEEQISKPTTSLKLVDNVTMGIVRWLAETATSATKPPTYASTIALALAPLSEEICRAFGSQVPA